MDNIDKMLDQTVEIGKFASKIKLINKNIENTEKVFQLAKSYLLNSTIITDEIQGKYDIFLSNRLLYRNKIDRIMKKSNVVANLSIEKAEIGDSNAVNECFEDNKNSLGFASKIEKTVKKMNMEFCKDLMMSLDYHTTYNTMPYNSNTFLNVLYKHFVKGGDISYKKLTPPLSSFFDDLDSSKGCLKNTEKPIAYDGRD